MKKSLLKFVLCLLWMKSSPLYAGDFLPKSFTADVQQSIQSALGNKRISNGILKYKFKGNVYFEIISPKKEIYKFISNPKTSWYYIPPFNDKSKGELNVRSTDKMPLTMFFDSLDSGLVNNSNYDVNRVDNHTIIQFKEKLSKPLGLAKAYLYFKNAKEEFSNLEKIQLFYTDNREVELSLKEMKTNISLEDSLFQFVTPPNTNVK